MSGGDQPTLAHFQIPISIGQQAAAEAAEAEAEAEAEALVIGSTEADIQMKIMPRPGNPTTNRAASSIPQQNA